MTSVKPRPSAAPVGEGPSEYEILKRSHRFLREEDDQPQGQYSWDETLARKFYSNLWKEYALCDLKHYKSGNFSLRWRTEEEVVSGAGESSCGNTRCKYHEPSNAGPSSSSRYGQSTAERKRRSPPVLRTLELPFGYVEQGELKSALVKVVLCEKCVRKIMWKREQIKRSTTEQADVATDIPGEQSAVHGGKSMDENRNRITRDDAKRTETHSLSNYERRRPRLSRSRSPGRRAKRDKCRE